MNPAVGWPASPDDLWLAGPGRAASEHPGGSIPGPAAWSRGSGSARQAWQTDLRSPEINFFEDF